MVDASQDAFGDYLEGREVPGRARAHALGRAMAAARSAR
jgi:hypothetical protein